MVRAELVFSPEGHVYLDSSGLAREELEEGDGQKIVRLFEKGASFALLHLGIGEWKGLPTSFVFWEQFAKRFLAEVCKSSASVPSGEELEEKVAQGFSLRGFEYLSVDQLLDLWKKLENTLQQELQASGKDLGEYLAFYNSRWGSVGKVCFHLAENKNDLNHPFAFLATYVTSLSRSATLQHRPLKMAFQESKDILLNLLLPIQRISAKSDFFEKMLEKKTIFQAQKWTSKEALSFLRQVPLIEESGVLVRIPNWWNPKKPSRPKVAVEIGKNKASLLGLDALLDFKVTVALEGGETLSQEELQRILSGTEDFVLIKGQWVEVDREKLNEVLKHWKQVENASQEGMSMSKALRLLAGEGGLLLSGEDPQTIKTADWVQITAGDWLQETLKKLKEPQEEGVDALLQKHLAASLRPYQKVGVSWLYTLYQLRLGGCLADDMGLGKTIQVLSLFLLIKYGSPQREKRPHLLVVPASLLFNWMAEARRFAPSLTLHICHSMAEMQGDMEKADVILSTYSYFSKVKQIKEGLFDCVILDEAQAIKNGETKQAKSAKALRGSVRFALTGTPIENKLGDLWSLFDFTSEGLLGSSQVFASYVKKGQKAEEYSAFMAGLRRLTRPYILRRLKSDKRIITDLPDKVEVQSFCYLSEGQVSLYEKVLQELRDKLSGADGVKRRGLVLSSLLQLKQICNHPVQFLGVGDFEVEKSGKFIRLQDLCTEIAAKQEKVLVFTQFREIIPALCALLERIFGREGLFLHGETAVKKRGGLVEQFQQEQGPSFFVLSLRAGGTGLNLTRASHVIHFDRWWNPAVENQATDRAYRIGQKSAVLVHKFVCQGTLEEKIDAMISAKQSLSQEILGGEEEVPLTELSDEALLRVVSLDIKRALG